MLRSTVGASPLTQGKRHDPDHHSASTVLPRSQGENKQLLVAAASQRGSSPLTRGKRDRLRELRLELGLIPAYAGKTTRAPHSPSPRRAHPHSRGENGVDGDGDRVVSGSSPLTRGKRREQAPGREQVGLIPAHAGKTASARPSDACPAAHPRSRGENLGLVIAIVGAPGSSPLTRGKLGVGDCHCGCSRLIPAHAGKTGRSGHTGSSRLAHPRSRGENTTMVAQLPAWEGSSPLTRGKPLGMSRADLAARLIPAHAGKTAAAGGMSSWGAAHPRSRGENLTRPSMRPRVSGSSPLTRGKHLPWSRRFSPWRLIPAHAGKTPGRAGRGP